MNIAATLRIAAEELAPFCETPRFDAELLMAHALRMSRSQLLLDYMQAESPADFAPLLARRMKHEPIAYITGVQEFWGLDFAVTPDVLIPRPDSETLIEAAIETLAESPPRRILDLGTGSGALLLAVLSHWPDAEGTGMDASEKALAIAGGNAERLGMGKRATFRHGDWRTVDWTDALGGPFDLVLANPPYVKTTAQLGANVRDYEPHSALFAGDDGLDDYRILIPALEKLRCKQALAIFEIGASLGKTVGDIAVASGYDVTLRRDLAGKDRALILR